jgi:hypothetical protein
LFKHRISVRRNKSIPISKIGAVEQDLGSNFGRFWDFPPRYSYLIKVDLEPMDRRGAMSAKFAGDHAFGTTEVQN